MGEVPTCTYSGGDGRVHVYGAADVRAYGVDGGVGAEAQRVHAQVGGALLDHLPDDVDLDLRDNTGLCTWLPR